jgi:dihydroorotate dehydrogenase electron transfer subunit
LLVRAADSFARMRGRKLTLIKGKSRAGGKRAFVRAGRQAVLDAELLAAGGGKSAGTDWEHAIRHLAGDALTLEDAYVLRRGLQPAEIERHRSDHAAELLRGWGRVLGYAVRKSRNAEIRWTMPSGRTAVFTPGQDGIRVSLRPKGGPAGVWGFLDHRDLDRGCAAWRRRHPETAGAWTKPSMLPEDFFAADSDGQKEPSPAKDLRLKVIDNRAVCGAHYLMTVEFPKGLRMDFVPGQFFHLACDPQGGGWEGYPLTLRRPLSIHRARYPGFDPAGLAWAEDFPPELLASLARNPSRIEFLYRVVGEGTGRLSRLRKGTVLDAIGPCGRGFSSGGERTAVIVAGGIGIAPLAALAEHLRFLGREVLVYVGAVGKDMLNLAATRGAAKGVGGLQETVEAEFREIGARVLTVCTDDGSAGEKGLVTEMLAAGIRDGCVPREDVCLYACGPAGMLRATAAIAARHGLECQVSLEERMACGIGACYSCTVSVRQPDGTEAKKRVCREGPVFDARDILWKD